METLTSDFQNNLIGIYARGNYRRALLEYFESDPLYWHDREIGVMPNRENNK